METGLDYFLARYYSPVQGRFTSVDPLNPILEYRGDNSSQDDEQRFENYLSQPQNWNRYGYALNNPILYIDTDGREVGISYLYKGNGVVEARHTDPGNVGGVAVGVGGAATALLLTPGGARLGLTSISGIGTSLLTRFAPLWTGLGAAIIKARDAATEAIQNLKHSNLSDVTLRRVDKALNALKEHMTNSDIKGAIGETAGLVTRGDHRQEIKNTIESLKNLASSLKGALQNPNLSTKNREVFSNALKK